MKGTEINSQSNLNILSNRDGIYLRKPPIVLIKDIKSGCYSDDPKERKNSTGGAYYPAPALYRYGVDPNWNTGKGYYYKDTHIIPVQYMKYYKQYFKEINE